MPATAAVALSLALTASVGRAAQQEEGGATRTTPATRGAAQDAGRDGLVPLRSSGLRPLDAPDEVWQAAPLTADAVADRLSEPDLDLREQHLDELVSMARTQADVRAALEEVAEQEVDPELAWSARLAMKLVEAGDGGQTRPAPRALAPWSAVPLPGGGATGDPFEAFDELLRSLRSPGGRDPFESLPFGPALQGGSSRGLSAQVETTPEGTRLRLEERHEDGEVRVREYEGESLDAILEANPDLAEELRASGMSLFGSGLQRELTPFGGDPFGGLDPFEGLRSGRFLAPDDLRGGALVPVPREGAVRTDVLGVRVAAVDAARGEALGLEPGVGLQVAETVPGTIAAALGVPRGAVLVELDGRALRSVEDVAAALAARAAGDAVELVWLTPDGARHARSWTPPAAGDRPPRDDR